jgi:hypothetical protein
MSVGHLTAPKLPVPPLGQQAVVSSSLVRPTSARRWRRLVIHPGAPRSARRRGAPADPPAGLHPGEPPGHQAHGWSTSLVEMDGSLGSSGYLPPPGRRQVADRSGRRASPTARGPGLGPKRRPVNSHTGSEHGAIRADADAHQRHPGGATAGVSGGRGSRATAAPCDGHCRRSTSRWRRQCGGYAQQCLAGLVVIVTTGVVATGLLGKALLATGYSPAQAPASWLLVFGGFFTAVSALVYIPFVVAWRSLVAQLVQAIYPLPETGLPTDEWPGDRNRLRGSFTETPP